VSDGVSQQIEVTCQRWPDRVAVHDARGEAILFRSFFGALLGFAEQARDLGISAGDVVALRMTDPTAGIILRLSLLRIGAVVVDGLRDDVLAGNGVNPAWYLFDHTPPVTVRNSTARQARVSRDWLRPPSKAVPIVPGGLLVGSTSGTTGLPRLLCYSEAVLAARWTRASSVRGAPSGPSFVGYGAQSSPAMNHFMRTILAGMPVVQRRPSLEDCYAAMERYEVAQAYLSPYTFSALLGIAEAAPRPLRSIARVIVGGGGVHPLVAARAEVAFGCPVFNSYGSSETGAIAMIRVVEAADTPGLVGRPHEGLEITFRHRPGAGGDEILIRPPAAVRVIRYPNNAPTTDTDGWVATGDLGHLDQAGRIVLTGRLHELLNVGGVKRAPGWFEDLAHGFAGVLQAAAFALPDGRGTDAVGLAVVATDSFDLDSFAQYMHRRLGPVFPLRIGLVEKIPSNAGGKVDRQALCNAFSAASGSLQD
jgi:acyl-coenzyme A synthetase/AMP-(fatty) acid ligase